jgi:hypothetical protein
MGPGRALFSGHRLGFRCALFDQLLGLAQIFCEVAGSRSDGDHWPHCGLIKADELRTTSEPCFAGPSDGAGGS